MAATWQINSVQKKILDSSEFPAFNNVEDLVAATQIQDIHIRQMLPDNGTTLFNFRVVKKLDAIFGEAFRPEICTKVKL